MIDVVSEYSNGRREFSGADLSGANLSGADLSGANLSGADLYRANLSGADLYRANLYRANLSGANLSGADLSVANLRSANLSGANLSGANLRSANLSCADLSGATGLPDRDALFAQAFEATSGGWLAYKVFGLHYRRPPHWTIEPRAVITEQVAPCPTDECGCGVSVGTAAWILSHKKGDADIWRVLIPYSSAPSLVVPYVFDGKVRCGRVQLIETISYEELTRLAEQERSATAARP